MWGPTVAMGKYKLYLADPQAGQVGFFGTIEEHGHPAILGLRLKIDSSNKKISEMEVIALRKTAGVFSEPQNLVSKPIFHQALAPSERRPRAELIRLANSYFEGMEQGTDKNTPFAPDCQRIENGVISSNDPSSKSEITRMRCGTWADGTEDKVNPPFDQPFSFFIAELFKIVDGKINRIEALVTPVPYGMWTDWSKK